MTKNPERSIKIKNETGKSNRNCPFRMNVHNDTLPSQDPRLSRGLGIALEGHDTDNAPKGASNGSANCIADSWRAPEGAFLYALVFLLPVNGSMNSFKLI